MDDEVLCAHRFSDGGLCNYPRDHRSHTRWPQWEPTYVRHPFIAGHPVAVPTEAERSG